MDDTVGDDTTPRIVVVAVAVKVREADDEVTVTAERDCLLPWASANTNCRAELLSVLA